MLGIIGRHLTIDMYGCIFEALDNVERVKEVLNAAAEAAGLTLADINYHKFEPQGLAAMAVLREGHLTIHTYPNMSYAAIDLFLCGEAAQPEQAVRVLKQYFKPEKTKTTNIRRGDVGSKGDMKPRIKVSVTPMRRVRDTGAKVFRFLSRSK